MDAEGGGSGRRETSVKQRWNNKEGKLSERRRVNESGAISRAWQLFPRALAATE